MDWKNVLKFGVILVSVIGMVIAMYFAYKANREEKKK